MDPDPVFSVQLIEALTLFVCICLSAYFSAVETALTSLTELKVKHLIDSDEARYRVLKLWLKKPRHVLTTILIGNNFVNIFSASMATVLALEYSQNFGLGLATGLTTIIILIVGEIIPKTYAKSHAQEFARRAMPFLTVIFWTIYPVSILFLAIANLSMRFSGAEPEDEQAKITEDELEFLINVGEEEGVIEGDKSKMLANVFDFGDTVVREVMIPRTQMVMFPVLSSLEEVLAAMKESGHSRVPIFDARVDNIIGILYAKDLLDYFSGMVAEGKQTSVILASVEEGEGVIRELMRDAVFIPEIKKIDDLFRQMKKSNRHIAIAIDEYGGTAGLVTVEDLLEEIVGELRDEFDPEEDPIQPVATNEFLVSAALNIDEFKDYFSFDSLRVIETEEAINNENGDSESEDEFDSIGGFFIANFGAIPKAGDRIEAENFTLIVDETDGNRINRLKVILSPEVLERDKESDSAFEQSKTMDKAESLAFNNKMSV